LLPHRNVTNHFAIAHEISWKCHLAAWRNALNVGAR
jgi:hypothetical protein